MTTLRSLAARGLSFAHLTGRSARSARADDDAPDDEKNKSARRAEDDEPEKDDTEDKGGAKGAGADRSDDEYADEDDDKDEKDGKAKGKKARAEDDDDDERADEDDDDEEEMRDKSSAARARRREQARCASIMGAREAGRNVELAANLAFKTRMTRQEALAVLRSTPAASIAPQRADRNPSLGTGGERAGGSRQAVSASWDRAMNRAAGPARK